MAAWPESPVGVSALNEEAIQPEPSVRRHLGHWGIILASLGAWAFMLSSLGHIGMALLSRIQSPQGRFTSYDADDVEAWGLAFEGWPGLALALGYLAIILAGFGLAHLSRPWPRRLGAALFGGWSMFWGVTITVWRVQVEFPRDAFWGWLPEITIALSVAGVAWALWRWRA